MPPSNMNRDVRQAAWNAAPQLFATVATAQPEDPASESTCSALLTSLHHASTVYTFAKASVGFLREARKTCNPATYLDTLDTILEDIDKRYMTRLKNEDRVLVDSIAKAHGLQTLEDIDNKLDRFRERHDTYKENIGQRKLDSVKGLPQHVREIWEDVFALRDLCEECRELSNQLLSTSNDVRRKKAEQQLNAMTTGDRNPYPPHPQPTIHATSNSYARAKFGYTQAVSQGYELPEIGTSSQGAQSSEHGRSSQHAYQSQQTQARPSRRHTYDQSKQYAREHHDASYNV